ncbi:MAG: ankyrin repeat domain-containing protein [Bacteroidales bacterium]|nr:ankyrin repeat domain-containing protein [Bacteroidales bacterium]
MKINFLIILFSFSLSILNYAQTPVLDDTTAIDTSEYIAGNLNYNLIIAADKGYEEEVLRLLNEGAEVNSATWEGVTPLMYATQNGHLTVCQILLLNGADPDKKPDNGITALITAIMNNDLDIAELLIRNQADINLPDFDGITPLMHAIIDSNIIMTDMLLYYEADISGKDQYNNNAVIVASYLGYTDIVKLLLESGADPNTPDYFGYTALSCAIQNNHQETAQLLLTYGAKADTLINDLFSPLAIAVIQGNLNIVKMLKEHGANLDSYVSKTMKVYDLAKINRNDSIVAYLKMFKVSKSIWPAIGSYFIGATLNWNFTDFLTGPEFGFHEYKYNADISAGYLIRPSAIRILSAPDADTSYQYWERRHMIYTGLNKNITLYSSKSDNFKTGISLGIKGVYTWGGYRGSTQKPDNKILAVPLAGLFLTMSRFQILANYEYTNLGVYKIDPGRIFITFRFHINNKKTSYKYKTIPWLQDIN